MNPGEHSFIGNDNLYLQLHGAEAFCFYPGSSKNVSGWHTLREESRNLMPLKKGEKKSIQILKFCKAQELNWLTTEAENGELAQGIAKSEDSLQKHVMSVLGQWTCSANLTLRNITPACHAPRCDMPLLIRLQARVLEQTIPVPGAPVNVFITVTMQTCAVFPRMLQAEFIRQRGVGCFTE